MDLNEEKTIEYYEVIPNGTFASFSTYKDKDGINKPITTIEQADLAIKQWGCLDEYEKPTMTAENKEYWRKEAAKCTVEKVTEFRKRVK